MTKNDLEQIKKELVAIKDFVKELPTRKEFETRLSELPTRKEFDLRLSKLATREEVKEIVTKEVDKFQLFSRHP